AWASRAPIVVLPDPETPIRMMIIAYSSCVVCYLGRRQACGCIAEGSGRRVRMGFLRHVHENTQNLSNILPIRPIRFPLSEFQVARREQYPIPAVAGCRPVPRTRV